MRWRCPILLLVATACGGVAVVPGANDAVALAFDIPALVSAGADRDVLRGYPTRLDGSGTVLAKPVCRGPEVPPACVSVWWREQPHSTVFPSNKSDLNPTFVAPLAEGELRFRLIVDTGTWTSEDEVVLHVRAAPDRQAPRVQAVADRILAYNEAVLPGADDIRGALADGVIARWEPLVARRNSGDAAPPDAAVFKLIGERDGLESAPDHLVLFPFDDKAMGERAPVASLQGEEFLAPGEPFTLDASASTDANGDLLRWRWEQTRGDALLPAAVSGPWVVLRAPQRPQEISLRVYVRDGALESAPAELSVVVGQGVLTPLLYPTPDQRTRPGRLVVLDALGGITAGAGATTYEWHQTLGAPAVWSACNAGQGILVTAPAAASALAFTVLAEANGVASAPAVIAVTVVDAGENTAPSVVLSAPSEATANAWVDVAGTLRDPEGDRVTSAVWAVSAHDAGGQPLVATFTEVSLYDAATGSQPSIRIETPAPGATIDVHLSACDEFSLCAATPATILIR